MEELKIGVVGYSAQKFNEGEAQRMISEAYDTINSQSNGKQKTIVSGLTDLGIPAVAYREAVKRGWKTIGVACSKAEEYDCFPVNERQIIGNEWGDESETFLNQLEILVRVSPLANLSQISCANSSVYLVGLPSFAISYLLFCAIISSTYTDCQVPK